MTLERPPLNVSAKGRTKAFNLPQTSVRLRVLHITAEERPRVPPRWSFPDLRSVGRVTSGRSSLLPRLLLHVAAVFRSGVAQMV